jgi:dTDP-4-dehydrorhamnose reductase
VKYRVNDFKDFTKLIDEINALNPRIIINCLGLLVNESKENPFEAIRINSFLPKILEEHYRNSSVKILQISTDCVFNGDSGPYLNDSIPDALDVYGITKALGELSNLKDLTIRTSIIGPNIKIKKGGLFDWFYFNNEDVYGYNQVYWSGVTTLQLAIFIYNIIDSDLHGVVNLSNNIAISKFELLKLINLVFFKSMKKIIPNDSIRVNKTLACFIDQNLFYVPSYYVMLIELLKWIKNHHELYSDYILSNNP